MSQVEHGMLQKIIDEIQVLSIQEGVKDVVSGLENESTHPLFIHETIDDSVESYSALLFNTLIDTIYIVNLFYNIAVGYIKDMVVDRNLKYYSSGFT